MLSAKKNESVKSCLIALREIVLKQDDQIKTAWEVWNAIFLHKWKNALLFMDS